MQALETRTRPLQGAQLTQLLLGGILCLTIEAISVLTAAAQSLKTHKWAIDRECPEAVENEQRKSGEKAS
ncbi:GM10547 [Drosophila sechellia]|uniref:GM10547 n=1 Tax=Drosophila sechellia TaxID=7238 RepID=B4I4H3_DROSE|nr:GM10547 [Drosophila sechellia]